MLLKHNCKRQNLVNDDDIVKDGLLGIAKKVHCHDEA